MTKSAVLLVLFLLLFSCKEKDDFQKIAETDVLLGEPQPGEWLADHPEKGQTFEAYSKLTPMKPNDKQNKIYILPMGDFTPEESKILDLTVEYLELFYGIKTVKMPAIKDNVVPVDKRRMNEMNEQLDAAFLIHEYIPGLKPKDALVIMMITSKDLYPKPSWNYVFGLASYSEGVGVGSMFRYEPNGNDFSLALRRTIKVSAHEIGHMFKMKHCTHAQCVMNGVNNLPEADSRPNTLCSVCVKKMNHNFGFNTVERFGKLIAFYEKHNLLPDAEIMKNQLETLQ
ncbi:archaemetzincin [Flavobacterium pedocola]